MTDAVWKGCKAGSLAEVGHVAVDLSQSEQDEPTMYLQLLTEV